MTDALPCIKQQPWMATATAEELREAAVWYQQDAAYTYRQATRYRDSGKLAGAWLASRVQHAAAWSAAFARLCIDAADTRGAA